jgi:hypothetical protein
MRFPNTALCTCLSLKYFFVKRNGFPDFLGKVFLNIKFSLFFKYSLIVVLQNQNCFYITLSFKFLLTKNEISLRISKISPQPAQANSSWDPISKITRTTWAGGISPLAEHLLCKCKVLSSNSSPTATLERKRERERDFFSKVS